MKAKVDIENGGCGNRTTVIATSDDGMYVNFDIKSTCDKINILTALMTGRPPVDVHNEVDRREESQILTLVRSHLVGGCPECAVPIGMFKAMQVAAGLAQAHDMRIHVEKGP